MGVINYDIRSCTFGNKTCVEWEFHSLIYKLSVSLKHFQHRCQFTDLKIGTTSAQWPTLQIALCGIIKKTLMSLVASIILMPFPCLKIMPTVYRNVLWLQQKMYCCELHHILVVYIFCSHLHVYIMQHFHIHKISVLEKENESPFKGTVCYIINGWVK